jgi:gamma-glutamyl-gamma-aminobutyrate hydrolase PuuD
MSKRILVGVTQRVMQVAGRNERRDALDQAWTPFFDAAGIEAVPVPNRHPDPVAFMKRLGVRAIVLSGGNDVSPDLPTRDGAPPLLPDQPARDVAPERDHTEAALLRASLQQEWPVLGVCRGMQVMNLFHGGSLVPLTGHAGTRHRIQSRNALDGLAFDMEVNSFHDFAVPVSGVAAGFQLLAEVDGFAEAIWNPELRHLGIMWHPERNHPLSDNDVALFHRFFGSGHE